MTWAWCLLAAWLGLLIGFCLGAAHANAHQEEPTE